MPKRTIALIIVLLLVTIGLLYLALAPKQSTPPVSTLPSPTPTPAAQTTLFLSPNPIYVSSSSGTIDINIDTQDNMVTAVQLELSYDPKALTSIEIASPSANSFFTESVALLKNIDRVNGKISYALGIPPTGKSIEGKGKVATITFRSLLTSGQTGITINPETQVTAEGISGTVLKEGIGGSIIFSSATPTTTTTRPSTSSATPSQ